MIGTTYPSHDLGASTSISDIFAPDTIMPSQYQDMRQGSREQAGERRLMLAVLEDAIRVITTTNAGRRKLQVYFEALDWVKADEPKLAFSFVTICDFLGIEHTSLRRRLIDHATAIKLLKRPPVAAARTVMTMTEVA